MTRQTSIQLTDETKAQIAALTDRGFGTQSNIIRTAIKRMYNQEIRPVNSDRQNKIDTVLDCLNALRRGVQEPTIVQEDDGSFSYIPSAYLRDASYTGSRAVVNTVEEEYFGYEFDVDAATDDELQSAAEYAADEWEWFVAG